MIETIQAYKGAGKVFETAQEAIEYEETQRKWDAKQTYLNKFINCLTVEAHKINMDMCHNEFGIDDALEIIVNYLVEGD